MAEITTSASVRLMVLDGDETVRAALTAVANAWPVAVSYARLDQAGLETLKQHQPQVVLLDGTRVRDHLPQLVEVLGHLRDLHQLILLSGDPGEMFPLPGIQIVNRAASPETVGSA